MIINRALLLFMVTALFQCRAVTVTVSEAWIAAAPDSVSVNAGYLDIYNQGVTTVTLTGIASPVYPRIEMHQSTQEGQASGMQQRDRLDIPAGGRLNFAPGGLHLMIYNTGRPPVIGETIPLVLHFADGSTLQTDAVVRKMSDNSHHHNAGHDQSPDLLLSLRVAYQYLLPQHFLSSLMYRLTRIEQPALKNFLIENFIRLYNVDMSIAVQPEAGAYRHFNQFFTRPLKPEARPIDPGQDALVAPVDGAVSQYGRITSGRLLQAKGHYFTATELLGGNTTLGEQFEDGEFITLYLSPRDYHRIHMPVSGTLQTMTYVPGDLFSVSPLTTRGVENLFARNERVVLIFDTAFGKVALVMVGAIFVGSMETVWAGEITPASGGLGFTRDYKGNGETIQLEKGVELGRFNMGSTVVMLFEKDRIKWDNGLGPDQPVKLGKRIARKNPG